MRFSIVPEIINSNKIRFYDEKSREISICKDSPFRFISPFKTPFIIIDTFAKKTIRPEEIISIDFDELKKLGFIITSIRAGRYRWFKRQLVIYRIESSSNISPGSKKLKDVPPSHRIEKDIINNKIRLVGPNAGFPRRGDGGPWIILK